MILQNAEGVKQIYFSNLKVEQNNAILEELETFADAINTNSTPVVTLEQHEKHYELPIKLSIVLKTT
jgi:hypothetical protein